MQNKVKLELTVEEVHAIINLLATIPANNSYYVIKMLKDMTDGQVDEIKKASEQVEGTSPAA